MYFRITADESQSWFSCRKWPTAIRDGQTNLPSLVVGLPWFAWCTALRCLCFVSLLDPLIERLQNTGVHCGDDIHRRVQLFFRHPRFPCVRKAPIHLRIAEPHHRDGETDQHLLAPGETFDGMRVAIERAKVGFLQSDCSCQAEGAACCTPTGSKPSVLSTHRSASACGSESLS